MKQLLCLLTSLSVFFACSTPNSKDSVKTYKATTDITGELSGEVIFAGQGIHNYYDVAITNDYYAFMDYYSDTFLQIRSKKDLSLHGIGEREKDTFIIAYPSFTKYDYINKNNKNKVSVWDNDSRKLKRMDLDQTSPALSAESESMSDYGLKDGCTNCCITPKELYAVQFNPHKPQVFFSSNKTNGQYAVPGYPQITVPIPATVLQKGYASDLTLNEEKGVIVAALRFIDCVNFYDMNCDMTASVSFADYYTIPVPDITNKYLNAEQSKKCFIDICSSEQYVFCLFDGSTNFTGNSVIYVFDWDGKQQAVLQADRNLRKIATEKSGEYLLALSPNGQGGRDVIKYSLKNKI